MDFQPVQLELGKLDTSTDPALLPPGALTLAENATCDTPGMYDKRKGYTALSAGPSGLFRLAVLGAELLALTGTNCWSYDEALGTWADRGFAACTQTAEQSIWLDQSKDVRTGTRASAGDITVHAWIESVLGDVYIQVRSKDDDAIISQSLIDDTAIFKTIHAVAAGQYVLVFYMSHGSQLLRFVRVDSATGTVTTPATYKSGADVYNTVSAFDVAPRDSTEIYIAWATNGPGVRVARFSAVTQAQVILSNILAAESPNSGVAVMGTVGEALYVAYITSAGNVRVTNLDPTSLIIGAGPTTVTTVAGGTDRNIGLCRFSSTAALIAFTHSNGGIGASESTEYGTVTNALVASVTTIHNVRMVTKPFTYGGAFYLHTFADYLTQYTYFTVRVQMAGSPQRAQPVAMHAYRAASTNPAPLAALTDVDQPETGVFAFDSDISYKFLSDATPRLGLSSFTIDFVDPARALTTEALGETFICGGIISHYDGLRVTENNFLLFPHIKSATPGAVGGGGMDDGVRSYIVIFESGDARGNVDRSTTSIPASATTAAGAGNGKVTLVIDHLTMTSVGWSVLMQGGTVSIFRTANGGTTYRYLTSVAMDATTANFTYVDQAQDSAIASNRILYTAGGVVDREPGLPSKQITVHRNRTWGATSADPKLLCYSGEMSPGEGVWFSSNQQVRIDAGGSVNAIKSLDDKLVAFKSDRIYKYVGSGLNELGQNSDLSPPIQVSTDCGCEDPRSVVATADGIMFRSAKGIQLLSRGEAVSYIGVPVELYTDQSSDIVAAVMLTDAREVRFEIGQKLVYNYHTQAWTTHVNYADIAAVDAIVVGGVYHWATSAGNVYRENDTFLDPLGTYIVTTIELGWFAPAGKQGLARCRSILVLADYIADHALTMELALNYSNSFTQTKTWSRTTLTGLPLEQTSMPLSVQKAEAYRIRISDAADGGTPGAGFHLRGFTLHAAAKRGTFRGRMSSAAKGA